MRNSDDILDYIPTQYIADFVKSLTKPISGELIYQGIEFRSVMNPEGFNLAIFTPDYFEITNIRMKQIKHISYGW